MIRIVVMKISITRQFVLKGIAIIGMMALHFGAIRNGLPKEICIAVYFRTEYMK